MTPTAPTRTTGTVSRGGGGGDMTPATISWLCVWGAISREGGGGVSRGEGGYQYMPTWGGEGGYQCPHWGGVTTVPPSRPPTVPPPGSLLPVPPIAASRPAANSDAGVGAGGDSCCYH